MGAQSGPRRSKKVHHVIMKGLGDVLQLKKIFNEFRSLSSQLNMTKDFYVDDVFKTVS